MAKRIDPIFLLLSLFLIWKVYFLHLFNHLSPDGAMIGLMARHILDGEFPIFFYGYGYIGSLKSLIAAGLFLLFGATEKVLLLLPILFYVGFVWTTYWLVVLIADRKAARIAMLLTLLCSHWLILFSAEIVGGYMDTLFYGNLLLIFLTKFCTSEGKQNWKWVLGMGLIGGMAFWQFPLSAYYLAPVLFCLFVLRPGNIISKNLPIFIVTFIFGSLPFWIYNWNHDFLSFSMVHQADFFKFWDNTFHFFATYIPAILGWGFQADQLLEKAGWFLLISLFAISIFWLISQIKWKWRDIRAPLLFLFFFMIFLFSRTDYVGDRSPMVVAPMLFVFPVFLGLYLSALSQHTKILFWGALLVCVLLYGNETKASLLGRQQNAAQFNRVQDNFIQTFKTRGADQSYAPFAIAPVVSFRTQEKMILSQLYEDPIPGYQIKVAASQKPGFMLPQEEAAIFEENLLTLGCQFKKDFVEAQILYSDIVKTRALGQEIEPIGWKAPPEIFDRDITTRWSTQAIQGPGQAFQLELPKVHTLSGLELRTLNFYDLPRRLKVEISKNGKEWVQACSITIGRTPLYWSGTHPFIDLEFGRVEMSFKPTKGRFIRLTQLGKSKAHYWSINELFLYEKKAIEISQESDRPKAQSILEETEKLIPLLIEMNGGPLYTDTWLSAKLSEKNLEETLKFLPLYNPRLNLSRLVPTTPQVTRFIDWEKNPVFVINQEKEKDFERSSFYHQNHLSKFPNGVWTLYKAPSPTQSTLTEIPRESWKAEAFPHAERSRRAIKPKRGIAWETFEAQKKGMFYLLDLGKAKEIQEIHLDNGKYRLEYPRYFEVLLSNDKQNWEKPKNVQRGVAYWDGKRILKSTLKGNVLPIKIERTKARYIKIALTEDFTYSQWRLEDIRVYQ